jgi:hypothetical protein
MAMNTENEMKLKKKNEGKGGSSTVCSFLGGKSGVLGNYLIPNS